MHLESPWLPIIGEEGGLWKSRTARQLVHLFQTLGFRDDTYDETKGGLPRLGNSELNTSKKNYVIDRLHKTSDDNMKKLIEVLITDSSEPSEAVRLINAVLILDNICLTIELVLIGLA